MLFSNSSVYHPLHNFSSRRFHEFFFLFYEEVSSGSRQPGTEKRMEASNPGEVETSSDFLENDFQKRFYFILSIIGIFFFLPF